MKILSSFQNRIKNWFGSKKTTENFDVKVIIESPETAIRNKIKENDTTIDQLQEHLLTNNDWLCGYYSKMKRSYELPEPSRSFILEEIYPYKDLSDYVDCQFPEARALEWKQYQKNLVNYQERWYNHLISELEQENDILYKALEILERN